MANVTLILSYFDKQKADKFCSKGKKSWPLTIRSHSGQYCATPLGASLALAVCHGKPGFEKDKEKNSQCYDKAIEEKNIVSANWNGKDALLNVLNGMGINEVCKFIKTYFPDLDCAKITVPPRS
jgi:hypothetical protein